MYDTCKHIYRRWLRYVEVTFTVAVSFMYCPVGITLRPCELLMREREEEGERGRRGEKGGRERS